MNDGIKLVEKWLADPESVSQDELSIELQDMSNRAAIRTAVYWAHYGNKEKAQRWLRLDMFLS